MSDEFPNTPTFKCEICGRYSEYHFTDVTEGKTREYHLCKEHFQSHPLPSGTGTPPRIVAAALSWARSNLTEIQNETNVPELIDSLNDRDPFMRRLAALVLGNIGPIAVSAVPALIERLRDNDPDVGKQASIALEKIDPRAGVIGPSDTVQPSDDWARTIENRRHWWRFW